MSSLLCSSSEQEGEKKKPRVLLTWRTCRRPELAWTCSSGQTGPERTLLWP